MYSELVKAHYIGCFPCGIQYSHFGSHHSIHSDIQYSDSFPDKWKLPWSSVPTKLYNTLQNVWIRKIRLFLPLSLSKWSFNLQACVPAKLLQGLHRTMPVLWPFVQLCPPPMQFVPGEGSETLFDCPSAPAWPLLEFLVSLKHGVTWLKYLKWSNFTTDKTFSRFVLETQVEQWGLLGFLERQSTSCSASGTPIRSAWKSWTWKSPGEWFSSGTVGFKGRAELGHPSIFSQFPLQIQ